MVNSVIKKVDTTVFSIWGVLRLAHELEVKDEDDESKSDSGIYIPDLPPEEQDRALNPGLSTEQKKEMAALLQGFRESGTLTDKDGLPHAAHGFNDQPEDWAVKMPSKEGVMPPKHKPRRRTPTEKEERYRQLKWFISHGFLKPSRSSWASAVSFVQKRMGACGCVVTVEVRT